ncbi:glycosyl hydrolase family 18 protein [Cysteiniphilum litorale]|uniref:glycosyl hydrolase family 18 protein n=1 Tax=Cysteiniphilum litorale TaxID=2056700 RepID=UPI003F882EF0
MFMRFFMNILILGVMATSAYAQKTMSVYAEMWAQNYDQNNPEAQGNIAYLLSQDSEYGKRVKEVNEVYLAFASWKKEPSGIKLITNTTNPTYPNTWLLSDGQVSLSGGGYMIFPEYFRWTIAKSQESQDPGATKVNQAKFLISFGGWTFNNMWSELSSFSDQEIQSLASTIVTTVTMKRPVYDTWYWYSGIKRSPISYVSLDGIDLDVETHDSNDQTTAITLGELQAIKKLVTDIKMIAPNMIITLTGRANAADTQSTPSIVPTTVTAGELLPLLTDKAFMQEISRVNVMAYDSGSAEYQKTGYQKSIDNYVAAINQTGLQTPVSLGMSMLEQYNLAPESKEQLVTKTKRLVDNLANTPSVDGIMIWALSDYPVNTPKFNSMYDTLYDIGEAFSMTTEPM